MYHGTEKKQNYEATTDNMEYYDKHRSDPHYNVGDKFLSRITGTRGKLNPYFHQFLQLLFVLINLFIHGSR
jgi:hypothetical protein